MAGVVCGRDEEGRVYFESPTQPICPLEEAMLEAEEAQSMAVQIQRHASWPAATSLQGGWFARDTWVMEGQRSGGRLVGMEYGRWSGRCHPYV